MKGEMRWSEIQDRQGTYNVTLSCVRATTVAVEMENAFHFLSVCL